MNRSFVAVFFWLVLGLPVRKTSGRLSRDCLLENQGVLWSTNVFDNSSFRTFPGISQNLPENVSIFFAKMIDHVRWLRKTKPYGGNWMKYCTVAKSMGRSSPIWTSVVVCARVACALRPVRSIPVAIVLHSRCAERCANDAFLTLFRATLKQDPLIWVFGHFWLFCTMV